MSSERGMDHRGLQRGRGSHSLRRLWKGPLRQCIVRCGRPDTRAESREGGRHLAGQQHTGTMPQGGDIGGAMHVRGVKARGEASGDFGRSTIYCDAIIMNS